MKKLIVTIAILLVSLPAFADGWESEIRFHSGNASARLIFGQASDATDGMDGQYDVPALLNGTLQVVFDNGQQLWRDIRSMENHSSSWTIDILTAPGKIVLDWETKNLPPLLLVDNATGQTFSMNDNRTLVLEGPRRLIIKMED